MTLYKKSIINTIPGVCQVTKSPTKKIVADMLETDIQKEMKDLLKRFGFFVFKIHQESRGKKMCHRGVSDLIAIKNGQVIFVEVKTRTGVQSDDQKIFEKDIKSHGGTYILVRSLDELVAALR